MSKVLNPEFDIKTDKLMSVTEILAMLEKANTKISRQTFYRWVNSGYFPQRSFNVGGQGRWTESSVKSWLEKCVEDAKHDKTTVVTN